MRRKGGKRRGATKYPREKRRKEKMFSGATGSERQWEGVEGERKKRHSPIVEQRKREGGINLNEYQEEGDNVKGRAVMLKKKEKFQNLSGKKEEGRGGVSPILREGKEKPLITEDEGIRRGRKKKSDFLLF